MILNTSALIFMESSLFIVLIESNLIIIVYLSNWHDILPYNFENTKSGLNISEHNYFENFYILVILYLGNIYTPILGLNLSNIITN